MSGQTPMPYIEGQSLDLNITRTFSNKTHINERSVTILEVFRITQSPVMVVAFDTQSGPADAILKLYDRRFGQDFRTLDGEYSPHTSQNEETWQQYVDQGLAAPFFQQMEDDQAKSMLFLFPDDYYEDSWEGRAKYEGGLQHQVLQYFDTETKTYERLNDLQGIHIPMMLAHVYVSQPRHKSTETEVYFRIPGILIQRIKGSSLFQLADGGQSALQNEALESIVQRTVNIANIINERGVIMRDCRPENVIVESATSQPFIHDFAQCFFRENCAYNPNDPNDRGYLDYVRQHGNPRAIGMVMTKLVSRERGFQLNIQYPELEEAAQEETSKDEDGQEEAGKEEAGKEEASKERDSKEENNQ